MNTPEFYIIRAILAENKKIAWRLDSGLGLAYTPPSGECNCHRLAASRVGVAICEEETAELQVVVMAAIRKRGCGSNGRFPIKPVREEAFKKGKTHHLLVWTWVIATIEL